MQTELREARENLYYENTLKQLGRVSEGLRGLSGNFDEMARAGVVGATTLANTFTAATLAVEGTAAAIMGVQNAAQGLATGDTLGTILGILQSVGGIVAAITGFINLFRGFQRQQTQSARRLRPPSTSTVLQGLSLIHI